MSKTELHIAISANERYMLGALVAAAGVALNSHNKSRLVFHLFAESIKRESIDHFSKTIKRVHSNTEVLWHDCDEALLAGLPYWAGSRMAAVRCNYATLMPNVDWCLYLDCDVLYLASIEEHFSYRDDSVYACVVQEECVNTRHAECRWIREKCKVSIADAQYFNSGVVLFNLKKMREEGLADKLMRFFKEHPDVHSPDQDALNATFGGRVKMIPPKFDRLQTLLTKEKMKERPVVHYVSGNPWLPKYGVVANWRFRMWHCFADKYIWNKRGESYRRCFTHRMLLAKFAAYYLLRCPIVGVVFAWAMDVIGYTKDWKSWRSMQI